MHFEMAMSLCRQKMERCAFKGVCLDVESTMDGLVMVNIDCQVDRIWNHLGSTPWGGGVLDCVN